MKNQLIPLKIISLFLVVLAGISCSKKNDTDETPFNVIADVYYKNIQINGEKHTARAYYVYGDRGISSAVAGTPESEIIDLNQTSNQRLIRFYEPLQNEYVKEYMGEGNYEFEIKSWDNIIRRSSDLLQIENLGFPEFEEFVYENTDDSYDISWTAAENAEGYSVKLLNQLDSVIFVGEILSEHTRFEVLIEGESGTWSGNVVAGQNYTLQLFSYNFDKESESTTKHLNIQEMSIIEKEFTWGE